MIMQYAAGLACLIAVLLQFAVHRDPTLIDTPTRRTGRRIMIVALLIGLFYTVEAVVTGMAPTAVFLMLVLMAMSQSIFAISDLWPHLQKELPWTSRLNSSP